MNNERNDRLPHGTSTNLSLLPCLQSRTEQLVPVSQLVSFYFCLSTFFRSPLNLIGPTSQSHFNSYRFLRNLPRTLGRCRFSYHARHFRFLTWLVPNVDESSHRRSCRLSHHQRIPSSRMGYWILYVPHASCVGKGVRADLLVTAAIHFLRHSTVLNLKTSYMAGYAVIGATAVTTAGLLAL